MLLFPISPAATVAAALLLVGGGSTPSRHRAARAATPAVAEDPNIRCATNRTTSAAIPFERVDLSGVEHITPREDAALISGPRMFAVIEDSTTWPAIWRVVADSMKPFPVTFGAGVLVLAATNTYDNAPADLQITSIRLCRRTGVAVVTTRETRPGGITAVQFRRRGIDLVRVPREHLDGITTLFDQHLQFTGRGR
jgi:hypothetical protein